MSKLKNILALFAFFCIFHGRSNGQSFAQHVSDFSYIYFMILLIIHSKQEINNEYLAILLVIMMNAKLIVVISITTVYFHCIQINRISSSL